MFASLLANLGAEGAEGESSTDVAFRLAVTDESGVTLNHVQPGSDVWLSVYVRDARASAAARGVYAAYLDVTYSEDLLTAARQPGSDWGFDIEFGPEYQNGPWAELKAPNEIDEVGAFQTGSTPLGSGEYLLFRSRFVAGGVQAVGDLFDNVAEDSRDGVLDVLANDLLRLGTAYVAGNPAERSPGSDVVLFSPPDVVPTSRIAYGTAQVDIVLADAQLITSVTQPATGGVVAIAADGRSLLYTPPKDFSGQEQFTYTVGRVHTAAVTVQVAAVNDAPQAIADGYAASRAGTLRVDRAHGVLRNDRDVERDPLTAILTSTAAHGNLVLRADGSFDYTPDEGFVGTDQFRYAARDASLWSVPATVTIQVGDPQAAVRLEFVDEAGAALSVAEAGDTVWVRGWVRDMRDGSVFRQGLGAVYLDLDYDPLALQPVLNSGQPLGFEVDFAEGYRAAISGDVSQAGVVDELGAASEHLFPPGGAEQLLFSMPFDTGGPHVADDAYEVSFQSTGNVLNVLTNDHEWQWAGAVSSSGADELPAHAVWSWEPFTPIPDAEVVWSNASLTLVNAQSLQIWEVGPTSAGGQVTISADRRRLVYVPARGFMGSDSFDYLVRNPDGRSARATVAVEVTPSWQNVHQPLDVNSDTYVTPVDALLVINYLNSDAPRKLTGAPTGPPFWDVLADGFVTPLDALLVINYLNRGRTGSGEGERDSLASDPSAATDEGPGSATSTAEGVVGKAWRAAYGNPEEMPWTGRHRRRAGWMRELWTARTSLPTAGLSPFGPSGGP